MQMKMTEDLILTTNKCMKNIEWKNIINILPSVSSIDRSGRLAKEKFRQNVDGRHFLEKF